MPKRTSWNQGQSGNPKGRPRGIKDKRTALRALLEPYSGPLVQKTVALALEGDTTALRLCLERLIPPVKSKDEPVTLEDVGSTLTEQGQGVLRSMLAGRITPDEAGALMQAISAQARVVQVEELNERVDALERTLNRRKKP